jgi:drug/metabolite transporter (DMT)-like permease
MHARRNALLLLHLTVFIWGFTGILGKLIQQSPVHMVYTRTAIAAAGLAVVALWKRRSLSPFTPDIGQYLLTSLLITAHWFTFFLAIKISTASIAAACLSTSTVFTALLEPLWFKRKLRLYEVVLGVIVVAALVLIFGLESGYREGILVATLSALLSAWFNIVNGVLVNRDSALRIGFYEMVGAVLVLGAYLPIHQRPSAAALGIAHERHRLSPHPRIGLHLVRLRSRYRRDATALTIHCCPHSESRTRLHHSHRLAHLGFRRATTHGLLPRHRVDTRLFAGEWLVSETTKAK